MLDTQKTKDISNQLRRSQRNGACIASMVSGLFAEIEPLRKPDTISMWSSVLGGGVIS